MKDLDNVFSLYIRHKNKNADGLIQCVTCSSKLPVNQMQNGHFMSRRYYITRWEEFNCNPQCVSCNRFDQGRQFAHALHIGLKKAKDIYKLATSKPIRFTDRELIELTQYFKGKLHEITKK